MSLEDIECETSRVAGVSATNFQSDEVIGMNSVALIASMRSAYLFALSVCTSSKLVLFNPLPTIRNSLKKLKSLYKVLTPSIKNPV